MVKRTKRHREESNTWRLSNGRWSIPIQGSTLAAILFVGFQTSSGYESQSNAFTELKSEVQEIAESVSENDSELADFAEFKKTTNRKLKKLEKCLKRGKRVCDLSEDDKE